MLVHVVLLFFSIMLVHVQTFPASFRILDEREEPGFLTGLKIPAPWAAGKTVETVHPVRDNYKFKETVHIPGARCLYLRFDPRCSSQYDYDKVSFRMDMRQSSWMNHVCGIPVHVNMSFCEPDVINSHMKKNDVEMIIKYR